MNLKLLAASTAAILTFSATAIQANDSMVAQLNKELNTTEVNANGVERVIVKFRSGTGKSVKALARKAGGDIKVDLQNHDAFAMEIPSAAIKGLQKNPNIEYIEEDAKRYLNLDLLTTEYEPWGISRVQADVVSDNLAANRTVCIIDSGYDIRHTDLSGNAVSGTNNSGTGQWSVPGGSHGTHVAGTIAAVTNGDGVVGVMPNGNINLHIIKVFNEDGWGYSSGLVAAADACIAAGSNVISMSLGGSRRVRSEQRAFDQYFRDGVLSIASAGNDGTTANNYPASYDGVVSIAAVDSGNQHANFSQRTSQIELSGPGEAVLSSVGLGDGQLAQLSVSGTDYFANGLVPHLFYNSSLSYDPRGNDGNASGQIAACTTSGTSYNCGDMTGKICVVERAENQGDNTSSTANNYPEYRPASACAAAGAEGVVVYSNAARPGLQNPFLIDYDSNLSGKPTISVDRATGLALAARAGENATMSKVGGQDWEYYNGTSMSAPHVSGVAALVWSYHTGCSASEVRDALNATALDLDVAGRDVRTGYGMVQAQAAVTYLAGQSCGGGVVDNPPSASFSYNCNELSCSFTDGSSDDNGISSRSWSFGDGASSSSTNPNHTYAADGSYTVTLTVTDSGGQTDSSSQTVTVSSGAPIDENPTASFTNNCTDLDCSFDASSSSDDNGISSYSWNFGDGNTGSGVSPSHSYASDGTYTVTLTVTDTIGQTDSSSTTVTVTSPPTGGDLQLSTSGFKNRGRHVVDLSWNGANSNNVDIFRNGNLVVTTANDGAYRDNIGNKGGATYNYVVCESGTSTCSSTSTVVF